MILVFSISCSTKRLKEGESFLDVKGGKVWYKVIGNGNKTPIVMLHGGPGFPSYYLAPLFELAKGRQIIVYDQLGCGRSSNLIDTSLMNIESQLQDLKALINKLEIKDFYLYSHSYGTMLAVDYYFKNEKTPKGIIFASPCMSTKQWELDADTLISSMDSIYSKPLINFKKGNFSDTAQYYKAIEKYYSSFYNKTMNKNIDSSIKKNGKDLYLHMWGEEEFSATGNLKNYNLINSLKRIKVPVLYTAGEFDAARPSTVKYYQSLTPRSKFVLIENAAHSTMNDNTKADIKAISDFINSLER
jgi:proline iminopeptidase